MADINDIAGMLGGLFSGDGDSGGSDNGGDSGIFGDIDPDMLLKMLDIVSRLNENTAGTAFLSALRPLLREENRAKLDRASMILKLMSILPLLRDQ